MLKLENISKYYYSSTSVTCALRKINLEFNIGEFVAISGESGSGKTTLLNLISGFDSYEDGEMYFNNKATSYFDNDDWENYRKNEIAFIFQNYNLIDSFTVLENVIVTYIIDGYSYKEAKNKAKDVLKLVGLQKDLHKKAIKLSGGQKQRLAIARALAKETKIIVADEPTGNLDVENGNAVLSLLKELSKDKLVIVVSHNLAQIEPFITRKIRLHDGEVVVDEKIVDVSFIKDSGSNQKQEKNNFKKIFNFSYLNFKSQPFKSFLLIVLVLVMTLASFVFYVNFKSNLDDNKTKELDDSFFVNFDETRLIAKKSDGSLSSEEEIEIFDNKHIVSIEKYDLITDINYYRPGDYKMKYGGGFQDMQNTTVFIDSSALVLVNENKFMRSYSCLSEEMLSAGRLPTGKFEMVVSSNDPSIIGTTETVLFKNSKVMGSATWFQYNVTIVGIIRDIKDQTYFSDDICKVMDLSAHSGNYGFYYKESRYGRTYEKSFNLYHIVIDPNLKANELSFPEILNTSLKYNSNVSFRDKDNFYYSSFDIKEWFKLEENLNKTLSVSDIAFGLSEEAFDEIYKHYKDKKQCAIYIDDYAYTDDVIGDLAKNGYDAISCFRSSVTGYDISKLIIRYVNLIVSLIALFIINLVIVFIALSIMKVKKNDYVIFKMLGLNNKLCKKINYVEVIFYALISNIILVFIYILVNKYVINYEIMQALKYVKFYDFFIMLFITLLSMLTLANKFSKFITEKVKITVLREE